MLLRHVHVYCAVQATSHPCQMSCHVLSSSSISLESTTLFAAKAINLRYLRDMKYISLETAAASVSFCATLDQQSSVEETPGRNEVDNHASFSIQQAAETFYSQDTKEPRPHKTDPGDGNRRHNNTLTRGQNRREIIREAFCNLETLTIDGGLEKKLTFKTLNGHLAQRIGSFSQATNATVAQNKHAR